ncbi:MAG: hypothetical protein P8M62_10740 [Opitutae bacterium]|nr:hypothetical protein [Opitutae bacterium]
MPNETDKRTNPYRLKTHRLTLKLGISNDFSQKNDRPQHSSDPIISNEFIKRFWRRSIAAYCIMERHKYDECRYPSAQHHQHQKPMSPGKIAIQSKRV